MDRVTSMAFLRRIWQRDEDETPLTACTALDIGTEFAKALVFDIDDDGRGVVRGVGRKRQGLSHMQSGTVADIAAVVDNCAVALQEAEEMAGFRPSQVVIGIAGELVKGFTTAHTQERAKPDVQITEPELQKLIEGVQREALREAERSITWETGLANVDVRLVHAATVGAWIDGYAVSNPIGFQGRNVKIAIFNAFAPLVHLGALTSVAQQLRLELLEVVAEPYAVARALNSEQVRQGGALFIDVGGGTTDVALVRQGGIEGTRMFALGGRAFTKSIADRMELPFPRAEALKVDYARGIAGDRAEAVRAIVHDDVAVWAAGVELVMEELAAGDLLPGRIYLCGGGSRLPEIQAVLADKAFSKGLPFARPPEVAVMSPDQIETIHDETKLLIDQQDVTPMGLAYQAIELGQTAGSLDGALRRVVRQLRI
jgi:cell division protein FtsA